MKGFALGLALKQEAKGNSEIAYYIDWIGPVHSYLKSRELKAQMEPRLGVIWVNQALCRTWSRDLPTVRFKTWHFVITRNEKSRKI